MAYCRPFLGLEGAGEGGRSCPSRSTCCKALLMALNFGFLKEAEAGVEEEPESDILGAQDGGGTSSTTCNVDIRMLNDI